MDWRHESACRDEDPELFFPIGNTGPAILQIEEAKQVCRRCEVREQCLAWALEAGRSMTGFATSVIGCKCEASIERELVASSNNAIASADLAGVWLISFD